MRKKTCILFNFSNASDNLSRDSLSLKKTLSECESKPRSYRQ